MSRGGYERLLRQPIDGWAWERWVFCCFRSAPACYGRMRSFSTGMSITKKKLRPLAGPPVESATVSPDRVFSLVKAAVGGRAAIEQMTLRTDFGRLFYEVKLRVEGVLDDAAVGCGERGAAVADHAGTGPGHRGEICARTRGCHRGRAGTLYAGKKSESTMPSGCGSMIPGQRKSCLIARPARFSKTKGGGGKCISRSCNCIS